MNNILQFFKGYETLVHASPVLIVVLMVTSAFLWYYQDLNCLLERYLEPLKEEMFLSSDEIDNIFGNIQEIALFQRQFLHSLEEAIQLDSPFFHGADIKHYRVSTTRLLFL